MTARTNSIVLSVATTVLVLIAIVLSGLSNTQTSTPIAPLIAKPVYAPSQSASFALVGDLGCGTNANQTLAQIRAVSPGISRLILLGDYSYTQDWKCFQNQLVGQGVESLVRGSGGSSKSVVVGNHEYNNGASDHLGATGRTDFINYSGLVDQNGANNYSFDYSDVHFTVLDTGGEAGQGTFSVGSKAYQFLLDDLRKSAENPRIDWRILVLHKNAYSSPNSGHNSTAEIRDAIHPLLDLYNVDLVVNGHTHVYERTYPIIYNYSNGNSPIKTTTGALSSYRDPEGQVFLTVGQGGKAHHQWKGSQPSWVAYRDNTNNGFLEIVISPDGTTLSGNYIKSSGGAPIDSFNLSKSVSGLRYDYAPYRTFNGVNEFYDPPTVSDMSIPGSFTVSAWFKTSRDNPPGAEEMIVNKGGSGSDSIGQNMNYGLLITDSEKLKGGFEDASTSNNDHFIFSSVSYNDSNWHMAVLTYNSNTGLVTLYVDGLSVGTITSSLPPETNNQPLRIGANSRSNDKYFEGQIDEVQIIRRSLSSNEVVAMYNRVTPFTESFG